MKQEFRSKISAPQDRAWGVKLLWWFYSFTDFAVQNQVEGKAGLWDILSLTAAKERLRRADKINFLHKLSSPVPSTKISSWFGVEARRKSKYPHWDTCSSMNGSHGVFADSSPSAPRMGKLEEAIFRYLLVFEAILHLCWLFKISLWHAPTCKFRTAYFSTADRNNCNNRTGLEEHRPLSGEICKGKQLQKGLFFKFKDKQKKPVSSLGERQATPVSIICGI